MKDVYEMLYVYASQGTKRMKLNFIAHKTKQRYFDTMHNLEALQVAGKIKFKYDKEYVNWEIL